MEKKNVRIKRENVELLLEDLIKQAKYINSHPDKTDFPYSISKLWVFGSYLNSDKSHLGDIDIFYELKDRWNIENRENLFNMCDYYISKYNPRTLPNGGNFFGRLAYPEHLTLQFLRNKHKAFSFMSIDNKRFFNPHSKELIYKLIYDSIDD